MGFANKKFTQGQKEIALQNKIKGLITHCCAKYTTYMHITLFTASMVQCKIATKCVGMQVRYNPLNVCTDPPCADYFFFELDRSTLQCQLVRFHCCRVVLCRCLVTHPPSTVCFVCQATSFHVTAVFFITAFMLIEFILNEIHIRMSNSISKALRAV